MMKLAWFTFFVVICNAKQAIGEWRHDGVDQPVSFTPVYGKHLRLLANPVNILYVSLEYRTDKNFFLSIFLWDDEAGGDFRLEKKLDWSRRSVCRTPSSRTRLAFTSLQLYVKHLTFIDNEICKGLGSYFNRYSYVPIIGAHIFVDDLPNQRGGIGYFRLGVEIHFIYRT